LGAAARLERANDSLPVERMVVGDDDAHSCRIRCHRIHSTTEGCGTPAASPSDEESTSGLVRAAVGGGASHPIARVMRASRSSDSTIATDEPGLDTPGHAAQSLISQRKPEQRAKGHHGPHRTRSARSARMGPDRALAHVRAGARRLRHRPRPRAGEPAGHRPAPRRRAGRAGLQPRARLADPSLKAQTMTASAAIADGPRSARPVRQSTIVMKFGGSSVADTEKIATVAQRLVAVHDRGSRVVGVISAMGDSTDELLALASRVSEHPEPRELDMLLSVGEQIACALVAMAVHELGRESISLTGAQAGLLTDATHGNAKIVDIRSRRIRAALERGQIVLVTGFQGLGGDEITTLGRGGSDATALALAQRLR